MTTKLSLASLSLAAMFLYAAPAGANPLAPSSGFIPSYAGPQNGDFEITSGDAFLHGSTFEFDATFGAAIGTTAGVFYVWGIDRGANVAPFGANRPDVLFDAVVISAPSLNENFVLDLLTNQLTLLTASQVSVSGDMLKLLVPDSLLPSTGFASPGDYLVSLWSRDGLNPADFTQIAEFAPSHGDAGVTVPEPVTLSLFGAGLVGVVAMRRRKRKPGA